MGGGGGGQVKFTPTKRGPKKAFCHAEGGGGGGSTRNSGVVLTWVL